MDIRQVKYEDIAPQFISLLEQRQIVGKEAVLSYLYPRLDQLPPPQGMKGLKEATESIVQALVESRKIVVWGDYDVDGTTATALLITFFRELGREVIWHIPDRITEGYGLNLKYLQSIALELKDARYLLLTVDCGITNANEITEIQKSGVDVIVTDHHQIQKEKLPACIIVNPQQEACGFSETHLAGVGVIFYLVAGVRARLKSMGFFQNRAIPNLKSLLAFVALGSIADMVPLVRVNRILVRAGMEALAARQYSGLTSLLNASGIVHGQIFSEDIGFYLGPKLNAAGRMGHAELAVAVLTSIDPKESERLAKELSSLNIARKERCSVDLEKALTYIDPVQVAKNHCCIIAGDFFHGTIGITASRLVERLHVPVIICAYEAQHDIDEKQVLKGSCRSIEGINIFKALDHCKEYLGAFGGHALAAGLSIESGMFFAFKQKIGEYLREQYELLKKSVSLRYHIEFPIHLALQKRNIEIFSLIDPFGQTNEKPIFYDKNVVVNEARVLGRENEHLHLTLRGTDMNYRGIGFSLGEKINLVREKKECEIIYTLSPNRYREKLDWQIRILDIW